MGAKGSPNFSTFFVLVFADNSLVQNSYHLIL